MNETKDRLSVNKECFLKIISEIDITDKYVNWLNDYEVTKYTEQRHLKHDFESVTAFVKNKLNSKNDYLYGIFYDDVHIGNIKLGPIRWEHKSAEISYFIGDKQFWGKGIASMVVKKLVDFAVKDLKLEKINAGYYEINIASQKVLEKCGFKFEGKRLSDAIFESKRINSIIVGYIPHQ